MVKIYQQPFAHAGTKQVIPDASDPQGFVSNADGFTSDYELPDTDPNYKPIERAEFNGLMNMVTDAVGELQQFGFAKWQPMTWPQGARVVEGGVVYRALVQTAQQPPHADWIVDQPDINSLLQPSMTDSITLNGTTNNTVVMTDIVPELALEIGDVIRIDTGAYNKLHTVESITNNSSIIVNYEHAGNRGNGTLKLPNFTRQATVTRIAKWFNAPIGLGQDWVAFPIVTNTAYQAPPNRTTPLLTGIVGADGGIQTSESGAAWRTVAYSGGSTLKVLSVEIPGGVFFRNTTSGAVADTRMMR